MANHLKEHPEYLNLGVINLEGDIVCSALPFKGPINLADRTYFRRTVETQDFSIGEYQIGRVTGKATLNFGYPDFDDRGRLQAVVFAALDLTLIEQVFVKAKRDEGSVFLMLDLKGTVLSRYPDLEKAVGKPFQDPSILKAIQAKQDEIKGQATGVDGIERLYAFTALRSGGEVASFIGIGIPVKAAFAEANRNLLNNLVLIGLVIVFVLAATWFGSNLFVLRQVNTLVSATKRLGSGDLSARSALPYGQNELGQLARSFDEMADSLEKSAAKRQQDEKALRENEARKGAILESALDCIITMDHHGRIIEFNPAAEKTFGYNRAEVMGKEMSELIIPPSLRERHRRGLAHYLATGEGPVLSKRIEITAIRADTTEFPVEVSILRIPGSEPPMFTGFIRDITERKRAEQEIRSNLERIQALREIDLAITSTLDLRSVLDLLLEKIDSLLTYAVSTTVRLTKKEVGVLEPVACRNLNESVWKAEQWKSGRGLSNAVAETRAPLVVENIHTDPRVRDREFFRRYNLVSYLGVPLIAKRELLGVLSIYTKEEHQFSNEEVELLTTLAGQAAIAIHNARLYEQTKKQAEELESSNKIKDEFLSVMSHELRTPLNVVLGYAEMIRDGMLGEINPKQEDALRKVLSRGGDLLNMIRDILYAVQVEARAVVVERQLVNLFEFFDSLKSVYSLPLGKEIILNWNLPPELPAVITDSGKLKQILQNLINNAIKFTEKGSVTISARLVEKQRGAEGQGSIGDSPQLPGSPAPLRLIEFKVTDTGIGIPKAILPIIFEKFRQVDSSETRLYGGVGLGLYIAKRFTELLGGTVEVESEPDKGSTFTVAIPVEN